MALLDAIKDILPTSFRGVPFSVRSASVAGGRFNVVHEFPNSDRRFVEDVGLNNKKFTIDDAFVSGGNVQAKRDALILALEKGGPGLLVHPYFGNITVNAEPYTSTQSMANIGEIDFTLEFIFSGVGASTTTKDGKTTTTPPGTGEVSGPSTLTPEGTTIPDTTASVPSPESVVDKNTELTELSDKNIADNFLAKTENNNFQDYIGKVLKVAADVRQRVNNFPFLVDAQNAVFTINNLINNLTATAVSIISKPETLANTITNLISSVISTGRSSLNQLKTAFEFFDSGNDDVVKIPNTAARREVAKNFGLLNGSINAIATSEAYKNIVLSDFETVEELREVLDRTEAQFSEIQNYIVISLPTELIGDEIDKALDAALEANESSVFNVITADVLDGITSVRDEANLIIKDKIPNLASVIEIDLKTSVQPLSVLTFSFYGNLDNRKKIASLNQNQNPIYLTGEVNIIS